MVVQFNKDPKLDLEQLDLGHLALFVGLRVNQLVMARMARAGFKNLRESHGYVIQHLIESERTITELARRMAVTQQAASKSVAELVRLGVLEESPGQDRRSKMIRLSSRGWKGVHASRRIRVTIHNRLQKSMGSSGYEWTKHALIQCLDALGGAEAIRSRRVKQPS
jgi:DNA-binding MarR family transcriptional regulator